MTTVIYYDAGGRQAGREEYTTRREALTAARRYVSRNGLNTYRTRTHGTQRTYYHGYGEREAIVRDEDTVSSQESCP